ncbi:MAG: hypothetical protein HY268_16095, partial [Deltaproteobacteria bacterium]|nr:hypothetical protein [Deltaproteobacteria bacterium]
MSAQRCCALASRDSGCETIAARTIEGYGITMSDEQRRDMHIRPITEMLTQIRALDAQPLTSARAPGQRLACVCRHFALMLCVILREQGMAARARCGFGAYFTPGKFEDHWVCEYWNAAQA